MSSLFTTYITEKVQAILLRVFAVSIGLITVKSFFFAMYSSWQQYDLGITQVLGSPFSLVITTNTEAFLLMKSQVTAMTFLLFASLTLASFIYYRSKRTLWVDVFFVALMIEAYTYFSSILWVIKGVVLPSIYLSLLIAIIAGIVTVLYFKIIFKNSFNFN